MLKQTAKLQGLVKWFYYFGVQSDVNGCVDLEKPEICPSSYCRKQKQDEEGQQVYSKLFCNVNIFFDVDCRMWKQFMRSISNKDKWTSRQIQVAKGTHKYFRSALIVCSKSAGLILQQSWQKQNHCLLEKNDWSHVRFHLIDIPRREPSVLCFFFIAKRFNQFLIILRGQLRI